MKTSFRISLHLFMSLWLLLAPLVAQTQSVGAEQLRARIDQLEKVDLTSKSKNVQEIYKRTLLRLYEELNAALRTDIDELRQIQKASQSDPQGEIAAEINKLSLELS